ncbi:hypothetical protein [Pseudomonas corrugata]|uniref:hypothetical protein n=1 Tax=Pseudomonas corrugata TaxID=47879 RepID=UPI0006D8C436|nr:hypothetical protein [Pseudomonas corrugata]MDU9035893.1 hypothetical protein [Pseudomonas corrugata]
MNKLNERMRVELLSVDLVGRQLPCSLSDLVAQGISEQNGCFFISALSRKKTNAVEADFQDLTGWECFINSIHIDDYVSSDYLANAFLLVMAVLDEWKCRGFDGVCQAIISSDEFGATVKFHFLREGEFWLGDDLEGYEESVLLLDSFGSEEFLSSLFH